MTDISPQLREALKRYGVTSSARRRPRSEGVDEFLKEAYRIQSHISSLHTFLLSIRQSYLSTSLPPRRSHLSSPALTSPLDVYDQQRRYLTDPERDRIDAEAKSILRQCNAQIRTLNDAETLRQDTQATLAKKKRNKMAFGALGRWAAGSAVGEEKSEAEKWEDEGERTQKVWRESVIWYLRRRLEEVGRLQSELMETRLVREVEKNKSVLYKAGLGATVGYTPPNGEMTGDKSTHRAAGLNSKWKGKAAVDMDEQERREIEQELSPEQLQLFAKENQNMVKHYEDTLDQVRTAEKSLLEISELQTQLANNLATQSAHIDQLVADSYLTTENVGGGNKELKKAAERKSVAKYVFYSSVGFSAFLIVYDLLI